jgi:hypothetical protein
MRIAISPRLAINTRWNIPGKDTKDGTPPKAGYKTDLLIREMLGTVQIALQRKAGNAILGGTPWLAR